MVLGCLDVRCYSLKRAQDVWRLKLSVDTSTCSPKTLEGGGSSLESSSNPSVGSRAGWSPCGAHSVVRSFPRQVVTAISPPYDLASGILIGCSGSFPLHVKKTLGRGFSRGNYRKYLLQSRQDYTYRQLDCRFFSCQLNQVGFSFVSPRALSTSQHLCKFLY